MIPLLAIWFFATAIAVVAASSSLETDAAGNLLLKSGKSVLLTRDGGATVRSLVPSARPFGATVQLRPRSAAPTLTRAFGHGSAQLTAVLRNDSLQAVAQLTGDRTAPCVITLRYGPLSSAPVCSFQAGVAAGALPVLVDVWQRGNASMVVILSRPHVRFDRPSLVANFERECADPETLTVHCVAP